MHHTLSAADLWRDVAAVRERAPLVHNITNLVVMNFSANALLAAGASPVMAHAHEEVAEMAGIAQALVVNIGTLDPGSVDAMELGLRAAGARGIPCVLDPVGAGATRYRDASVERLLQAGAPTVIRGNASEILRVAGEAAVTRGVDSGADAGDAVHAALRLAARTGGAVCASGPVDHVVDAQRRWSRIANGDPWMGRITGVGCSASALIGAFCAVQPDAWRAATAAMALLGVAGELAAERARAAGAGVGTMQALLLDALQLLDASEFTRRLRLEVAP